MAVVAIRRCTIRSDIRLTQPDAVFACRLRLAAIKCAAVVGLIAAIYGILSAPVLRLRSLTNPHTGLRMWYPARWEGRSWDYFESRATEKGDARIVGSPDSGSVGRPRGLSLVLIRFPLELYRAGPWAEGLPPVEEWTTGELLISLARLLRFDAGDARPVVRETMMAGRPALQGSGRRPGLGWGSVVACIDGNDLILFEVLAPDRNTFRRFRATWWRLVRRVELVSPPGEHPWLYGQIEAETVLPGPPSL
jgi:hypothetical protein